MMEMKVTVALVNLNACNTTLKAINPIPGKSDIVLKLNPNILLIFT